MNIITLDIETLPTEDKDVIDYLSKNLSAPANYKDPDKIAAYIEQNKDGEIRKTGLSGLFGRVFCIGYAVNNDDPKIIKGDEKEILKEFSELFHQDKSSTLAGHYINGFDIPFICQRMLINGLSPIYDYQTKPWSRSVIDTSEVIAMGTRDHISLEKLCLALGVKSSKSKMDGSQVYDYYLSGKHDEIYDYCLDDVIATRSCLMKMIPGLIK